jgi:hypothetical protein
MKRFGFGFWAALVGLVSCLVIPWVGCGDGSAHAAPGLEHFVVDTVTGEIKPKPGSCTGDCTMRSLHLTATNPALLLPVNGKIYFGSNANFISGSADSLNFGGSGFNEFSGHLIVDGLFSARTGVIVGDGQVIRNENGSTNTLGFETEVADGTTPGFNFQTAGAWTGTHSIFRVSNNGANSFAVQSDGHVVSGTPISLWGMPFGGAISAVGDGPASLGGFKLPAHAFTVTNISGWLSSDSGGGGGSSIITVTDGTNTCTFTWSCASSTGVAPTGFLLANPSGTCAFAASASLVAQTVSSGCTGAQPAVTNFAIVGKWQ